MFFIVDGDLAPDYNTAEEIWNSDTLIEDTEENKLFWNIVVEIYNKQSNAYREELELKKSMSLLVIIVTTDVNTDSIKLTQN